VKGAGFIQPRPFAVCSFSALDLRPLFFEKHTILDYHAPEIVVGPGEALALSACYERVYLSIGPTARSYVRYALIHAPSFPSGPGERDCEKRPPLLPSMNLETPSPPLDIHL
jgi:hypothetical protein